jgi:hypothetical protein
MIRGVIGVYPASIQKFARAFEYQNPCGDFRIDDLQEM